MIVLPAVLLSQRRQAEVGGRSMRRLPVKRVILFDSSRQTDSSRDASQFAEHCSCGKMRDRKGFVFVTFFIKTLVLAQRQLDYNDWEHV